MDNLTIERMTVDGRRAEVHTVEQVVNGATQRITEHFEEIIPLERKKKVVEHIMPIVVERVTEQYDGNQVNKVVERVANEDASLRLHLVPENHPVTAQEIEAIIRQVVNGGGSEAPVVKKPSWFSRLFSRWMPRPNPTPAPVPTPAPTPAPAVVGANNPVISYALITLLAVQVGFLVWQLFIR